LTDPHSGFLTKGDHNDGFDQPTNVTGVSGLVKYEQINAVAWIEIPWMGAFKMMWNGKGNVLDNKAPNTIPSLSAFILSVIFLLFGLSFLLDRRYYNKYRKGLYEEMNAPTPIFPVEDEKE
jgi:hypothetical protein